MVVIRTPTEVVKQRAQATRLSSMHHLRAILNDNGLRGLYRGFSGTLIRELPFVAIQFPLWEYLKRAAVRERGASQPHPMSEPLPPASPAEAAICGAIAGAIAAAATCPLDVVKTRLMLAPTKIGWATMLQSVVRNEGLAPLMHGVVPRVCWISAGGFIFLGGYSLAEATLRNAL